MSPESATAPPPRKASRTLLIVILLSVVVAGSLMVIYIPKITQSEIATSGNGNNTVYPPYTNLPAGCVKPPGGFLVVADINGFNDSIQHGAPKVSWPVINVTQGQTVNITVCNTDHQSHGFQVAHYFDSNIETVEPGQVVHVSFVANKVGTFEIYCSIFCSIHIYMQNAELRVLAT
jgi:hypothetical protein